MNDVATAKEQKLFREYLLHYHAISMIAVESEISNERDPDMMHRIDVLLSMINTPDMIKKMDTPNLKIMFLVSKLPTILAALTSFIVQFGVDTLDETVTVQKLPEDIYIFTVKLDGDRAVSIPFRNMVTSKPEIQH